jgi:adenylyl- and sulfurtransferase ThiI
MYAAQFLQTLQRNIRIWLKKIETSHNFRREFTIQTNNNPNISKCLENKYSVSPEMKNTFCKKNNNENQMLSMGCCFLFRMR